MSHQENIPSSNAMMNNIASYMPNPCPICQSNSEVAYSLETSYIVKELEKYYGEAVPDNLEICNYNLLRCKSCSLEFASPLQSGSNQFYLWITNHPSYYPDYRWEWDPVLEKISQSNSISKSLLEIGCGSGIFLEKTQKIPELRAVGLDTTQASVEKCQGKNLEVYCATIESFLTQADAPDKLFDFVVSFHCLEHVSDPKKLIQSMLLVLKPTGSIFVSTPYSPGSSETQWFDPLNHPPHHMTRWNHESYTELAQQLGLQINFLMPAAAKPVTRTLDALNFAWHGCKDRISPRRMKLTALTRPISFVSEWQRQLKRERVNNQTAADVVLVELSRPLLEEGKPRFIDKFTYSLN